LPPVLPQGMTEKVDAWLMHPWLGLPLFFAFMALLFNLTYQIGTPLQDVVGAGLDWFKAAALGPGCAAGHCAKPAAGWYLARVSTVLTFAPILFVFFILMAMVEDSGYLARAAYLTDAFMARLGLDGRGFVMQLMGFGCNVPAILGTRVMRERKQAAHHADHSVLAVLGSSAGCGVFCRHPVSASASTLGVTAAVSAEFCRGYFTAWVFKHRYQGNEAFLLEVPPYRLPGCAIC
jgi:ferrous iron transport protein B